MQINAQWLIDWIELYIVLGYLDFTVNIDEYIHNFLWIINFYTCYTFVIFICILIISIADHRFIPAALLFSADRFFIRINKDIIIIIIIIIIINWSRLHSLKVAPVITS